MKEARSLMTKKIIKVKPEMPIQAAYEEMKENGIRHLPVVDQTGKLVGMLSARDTERAINVKRINEIDTEITFNPHDTVENYMSWPVETIDEKTSIESLVKMMIELKVSAFVVSGPNQYIKGIITTEDILKYMLELLNTNEINKLSSIGRIYWDCPT